ncbi:hypothetical protein Moror_16535 [Moniliophthora roreri MCA 2997]|uniref:Uncharacterized protein n=2 Tax=Moniliophthora roreri TaxID=221103 RepID=V2YGJ9_MONRO|nr:hypothetical protein Moror_16535 [Moniliophthora roreri MCA 2997]KAI3616905.1 hypothetical protein WG66_004332 [Moniliophthora roreri]
MSSVTSPTTSSSVAYYGVGFLGIFSIASYFSVTKLWDRFRRERNASDSKQLQRQIEALREALQQKEDDLTGLREALAAEKVQVQSKQAALDQATEELGRVKLQSEKQLEEVRGRNARLAEALHTHAREVSMANEESQRLRTMNEQLQATTNTTSLTKPDRLGDVDVIRLVETLNGEICQTAELMADVVKPEFQQSASEDEPGEIQEATEYTKELLGEKMTNMLRNVDHREKDILLRYSFQASMYAYSEWIITSWVYRDRNEEQLVQEIYDRLREREEQPISAQWRILTRKYIRQIYRETPQPDLSDYFFDAFSRILMTAGLRSQESLEELTERLRQQFSSHVAAVINIAIQLNTAIGDSVTSCELVPIYCETGIPFDDTSMENTPLSGRTLEVPRVPRTDDSVLCTTKMGLLQSVKVKGRDGEWTHRILLRPKIILRSAFEIA